MLKEIFTIATAQKGGPDLTKYSFRQLMVESKVIDKNVTVSHIDTYFKASNFEIEDQEGNHDLKLCRFEFLEILIRVAKAKYIDFGQETNLGSALGILL